MTVEARVANHAQRLVLEEAVKDKLAFRRWYRTSARRLFQERWLDLEQANDRELRLLLRQLRRVRTQATIPETENRALWGDR
jgi:hypothetical protein